jgi:predicted nucleotidyltransferase
MTRRLDDILSAALLSERERRVLDRFLAGLRETLGGDLRAVWLYGSRARGDAVLDETDVDRRSDVDLIVIAEGGKRRYDATVYDLLYDTALREGGDPASYSVFVHDPEWLRARREIESFFIQEVDRDKLVLAGSAL